MEKFSPKKKLKEWQFLRQHKADGFLAKEIMNRKQRKEKLAKLSQQQKAVQNVIRREVDAMNASDVNDADGESPEAWAERIALEIMDSKPMPGVDE